MKLIFSCISVKFTLFLTTFVFSIFLSVSFMYFFHFSLLLDIYFYNDKLVLELIYNFTKIYFR